MWSRTVLFLTYDENGGFLDHVAPPVAPRGTPGEFLTTSTLPPAAGGVRGPMGLGLRCLCSSCRRSVAEDACVWRRSTNTSLLRFIETRFGVEVPNLSPWRRANTGDLTSAIDFAASDASVPTLPDTIAPGLQSTPRCGLAHAVLGADAPTFPIPGLQNLPRQESGNRRHRAQQRARATPSSHIIAARATRMLDLSAKMLFH